MTMNNVNDWSVDCGEHYNSAGYNGRGPSIEIDVDNETINVRVDEGSGYMAQQTTCNIPIEVMVRLIEHAGYVVTRRPAAAGIVVDPQ